MSPPKLRRGLSILIVRPIQITSYFVSVRGYGPAYADVRIVDSNAKASAFVGTHVRLRASLFMSEQQISPPGARLHWATTPDPASCASTIAAPATAENAI